MLSGRSSRQIFRVGPAPHPALRRRPGFALVIVLTMMSFLLLLVVTLSLSIQLEMRTAALARDQALARESARLALTVALGQLSNTAGPDQRVTARSDLLPSGSTSGSAQPGNTFWTGVWNANSTASANSTAYVPPLAWLVSSSNGSIPDPSKGLPPANVIDPVTGTPDVVTLVGNATLGGKLNPGNLTNLSVRVPVTNITSGVDSPFLQIAYWVGDEGIKAPIADPDRTAQVKAFSGNLAPGEQANLTANLKQLQSPMTPMLSFLGVSNPLDPALQSALARNPTPAQLPNLPGANAGKVLSNYYDITTQTAFTLVDTLNGGLKKDLTYLKFPTTDPSTFNTSNWNYINDRVQAFIVPYGNVTFAGTPSMHIPERQGFDGSSSGNFEYGLPILYPNVSGNTTERTSFNLHPVITEFFLGLSICAYPINGTNHLVLAFDVYAEIWNPFPVNFRYTGQKTPNTAIWGQTPPDTGDIQVVISGLPRLTITASPGGTSSVPLPNITTSIDVYNPQSHDNNGQTDVLRAGKVYWVEWPTGSTGTSGPPPNNASPQGLWIIDTQQTVPGDQTSAYQVKFGATNVSIKFAQENLGRSNASPQVFQTVHLNNYQAETISYPASGSATAFMRTLGTSTSNLDRATINQRRDNFCYYFKLNDELTPSPGNTAWPDLLAKYGCLASNISMDVTDADYISGGNIDFKTWADPSQCDRNNTCFLGNDYLMAQEEIDPAATIQIPRYDRYGLVFDLPTQDLISVGQLAELNFNNYLSSVNGTLTTTTSNQPQALGNEWGGEINQFYDRFFFSGLPANAANFTVWDRVSPLPNTRLIFYNGTSPAFANGTAITGNVTTNLSSANSSANLLLQNGFNVNSTSVNAWLLVLSGGNLAGGGNTTSAQWQYDMNPPDVQSLAQNGTVLHNTFFNFPFLAERLLRPISTATATKGNIDLPDFTGLQQPANRALLTFDAGNDSVGTNANTPNNSDPVLLPALRQGVCILKDDEVQSLAQNITQAIQQYEQHNGHPFYSMQDFVNSGVLKNAIANVTSINNPDPNNPDNSIIPYSPAYLSQATLINNLASRLFVRSDTFVIRAYGAVPDPFGGRPATAYCQARVQRVPDLLYPASVTGNSTASTDLKTRRQFKIIEFQWLSPNDI